MNGTPPRRDIAKPAAAGEDKGMLLGIGILAAAFAAAVWAALVRHAGWSREGASLAAFAICPLLFLAYTCTIDDAVAGGLAMMFGLPVAILAGLAGVGFAALAEAFLKVGGPTDPDSDGD